MTICQDIHMSEYKLRYSDDSEDPPDVGLSSKDEVAGMKEILELPEESPFQDHHQLNQLQHLPPPDLQGLQIQACLRAV